MYLLRGLNPLKIEQANKLAGSAFATPISETTP
ncbi:hypothetical protein ABIF65_005670 [Bradyrhizobium japonicum]|nr:hypothetical protein [Bradyrhizobium japonicum]